MPNRGGAAGHGCLLGAETFKHITGRCELCCAQEREWLGLTPALSCFSWGSLPPVALLSPKPSMHVCSAIPSVWIESSEEPLQSFKALG